MRLAISIARANWDDLALRELHPRRQGPLQIIRRSGIIKYQWSGCVNR